MAKVTVTWKLIMEGLYLLVYGGRFQGLDVFDDFYELCAGKERRGICRFKVNKENLG